MKHTLAILFASITASTIGCAVEQESPVATSSDGISIEGRVPRYGAIRDAAAARGITHSAYLLAGLAFTETGVAQCWSEATWACQGPSSPDCGGGPIIAGASDGPCSAQQGGLGMFQFDSGTYWNTIGKYGNDVLTVFGQVSHAVDYVKWMVKVSDYTTDAETDEKALAWIERFDPNDRNLRDQWVKTVLRYYNGCQPGWDCWGPRYRTYDGGLAQVLEDTGGTDFWVAGTRCPGAAGTTMGAIDAKYRSLGGCGSLLGAPITDERATPDGVGRYTVFERGSIYWTPSLGAHEVLGRIRDEWKARGWEAGPLGYPISGEYDVPGGRRSDFEHGSITWRAATDDFVVTAAP